VAAPLDQSYFTKIYRSIHLGKAGSIILLHRDGTIMARQPEQRDAIGKSIADGPLFTTYLPEADTGSYELTSPVDGVERIAGYRAVPGLPLVIAVTYAKAEVLEAWYRHLYTYGFVVAVIVAIMLLGTTALIRQANAIVTRKRDLSRTNACFDAALSNMNQGLCLFDADKKLVVSNGRYQEMYGLPDELVRPGSSLSRILQHYKDRGEPTKDLTVEQHAELMPTLEKQEYQLRDGRQFLIQRKTLPDGGWVATHEDVTEQKHSEQLLAEKAAALEAINMRFDAALNNMSQGLCMFDADQRVVVSNARYAEIYHLNPDQVAPGTTLAQILDFRRTQGTMFAGLSAEVYRTENVRQRNELRELADGRIIAIARHRMSDGGWLTTHEDVTDRARDEKRIAYLAQHDLLTGLANRALFTEELEVATRRLHEGEGGFALLMLDLDKFKIVNDTLGHPAGDELLIQVGERLKSAIRETDILARLGGDEFAIIQECTDHQITITQALNIISSIEQPFDLNGNIVHVGTSIGIAFAPENGQDPETLLKRADLALYAAKTGGRNDYRIFQPEFVEAADLQRSIEGELRQAVSRGEFELHYQPIVDVCGQAVCCAEAFVRWHHPVKGILAPGDFLALAESIGLMPELGEWVIGRACSEAVDWPPHVKVAVNVSALQLAKGNLLDVVLCSLVDSGLSPERLELEIGDTALLEVDRGSLLLIIRQLKNLGVTIVLDGCGAAYAAVGAGLPFDKLKIDRKIVHGHRDRKECAAVFASLSALAEKLNVTLAAKGVETGEQLVELERAGVSVVQGYLFGKPVSKAELSFHDLASTPTLVA
jgi:diguanylate cyclase (GGDEF)-like protein